MFNKNPLFIGFIFLLLLNVACKREIVDPELLIIRVNDVSIRSIQTNDIFANIEYVFLETHPECLLVEDDMDVYVTEKHIIAYNKEMIFGKGAYLFDRKSGKFLHEIGKRGEGPGEYNFIYPYPFNEKYELFYVIKNLQRIGIDIHTNNVIEKVFSPVSIEHTLSDMNYLAISIMNIHKMDSLYYIAFPNNDTGVDPYLLVIFDKEGNIVKSYPNHQKYTKYRAGSEFNPGIFYTFDNQLYFKEYNYNDTVFQVNLDTITPHFIFDLGKMKPNYEERQNTDYNNNCYWIRDVHETTNYIFFYYTSGLSFAADKYYDAYYHKKNGELVASESTSKELRGFVDENGLYPPFYISSINQSEEAVGIITASNLLDYIKRTKVTNYPSIVNSLQYDDNPIIVIAKLKK